MTSIVGVSWDGFMKQEPQAATASLQELDQCYARGKMKPVIDRTMHMAKLRAYAHIGSRAVMGKWVMVNQTVVSEASRRLKTPILVKGAR